MKEEKNSEETWTLRIELPKVKPESREEKFSDVHSKEDVQR